MTVQWGMKTNNVCRAKTGQEASAQELKRKEQELEKASDSNETWKKLKAEVEEL